MRSNLIPPPGRGEIGAQLTIMLDEDGEKKEEERKI
jgi:hypothetical protein